MSDFLGPRTSGPKRVVDAHLEHEAAVSGLTRSYAETSVYPPPLVSLAAFNSSRGGLHKKAYPCYNGIACPSCKGEMCDTDQAEDGTVPVNCPRCGYTYTRVA